MIGFLSMIASMRSDVISDVSSASTWVQTLQLSVKLAPVRHAKLLSYFFKKDPAKFFSALTTATIQELPQETSQRQQQYSPIFVAISWKVWSVCFNFDLCIKNTNGITENLHTKPKTGYEKTFFFKKWTIRKQDGIWKRHAMEHTAVLHVGHK